MGGRRVDHGMPMGRCPWVGGAGLWVGGDSLWDIHGVLVVMAMGCPSVAHRFYSWVTHGLPVATCPAGFRETITRSFFVEQRSEYYKNRWLYRPRPPSFSGFSTKQVSCWSLDSII